MRSICLLLATLFLAAAAPPQAREPKFEMERNPTLETLYIMVLLAPSWRTPDMGVRPLADDARKHFAPFANHPSVRLLDRMMREEGSGWITWIQTFSILAVSSPKPVPQASFDPTRIGFPDFAFPKQTVASAAELMEAANRFYRDAHVEEFRRRSEPAYTCAFEHVQRQLPEPALLSAMERFYGTRLNRYAVIPSPLQNIQIHMNVRVETPDGVETFMLVAPSKRAASAREFGCGFEDNPDLKWLVIHEYGHSFVNPMLEAPEIKAKIDRHAHLHGPIKDEQAMQGMSDWFGAVIEHVNRLGEIRILESVGDKEGAQNRRLDNVFARDFIYLPLLEDRVKEYETDRKSYPTFESFVPRLIDTFSDAPADAKP